MVFFIFIQIVIEILHKKKTSEDLDHSAASGLGVHFFVCLCPTKRTICLYGLKMMILVVWTFHPII